mgnify:CR=1 FL=1
MLWRLRRGCRVQIPGFGGAGTRDAELNGQRLIDQPVAGIEGLGEGQVEPGADRSLCSTSNHRVGDVLDLFDNLCQMKLCYQIDSAEIFFGLCRKVDLVD